jgi:hypothetical protein
MGECESADLGLETRCGTRHLTVAITSRNTIAAKMPSAAQRFHVAERRGEIADRMVLRGLAEEFTGICEIESHSS